VRKAPEFSPIVFIFSPLLKVAEPWPFFSVFTALKNQKLNFETCADIHQQQILALIFLILFSKLSHRYITTIK
jgi:hypothetical protein